jgi:hypothetical protein
MTPSPQLALPTTSVVLGPAAGTTGAALATVTVGSSIGWTASTTTSWIHLTDTNGTTAALGSVVRFTYDANDDQTRQGSISFQASGFIGTLCVTQAGLGYEAAIPPLTTLTPDAEHSNSEPYSLGVDIAGNVYYATTVLRDELGAFALEERTAATGSTSTIQMQGPSACPNYLGGILASVVNESGDIFMSTQNCAAYYGSAMVWSRASQQTTLLAGGGVAFQPYFATDWHGSDYVEICDGTLPWLPCQASTTYRYDGAGLTQLAATTTPSGFAASGFVADTNGNLFLSGNAPGAVTYELNPASAQFSALPALPMPSDFSIKGLALDGSGNFYLFVSDPFYAPNDYIAQWNPSTGQLTNLSSSLGASANLWAVRDDGVGNIYLMTDLGSIKKFTPAFVNTAPVMATEAAGAGDLPPVLPTSTTFMATSDSSWLTITGQVNGIVTYSYTAAPAARTAHISILNKTIEVSQP